MRILAQRSHKVPERKVWRTELKTFQQNNKVCVFLSMEANYSGDQQAQTSTSEDMTSHYGWWKMFPLYGIPPSECGWGIPSGLVSGYHLLKSSLRAFPHVLLAVDHDLWSLGYSLLTSLRREAKSASTLWPDAVALKSTQSASNTVLVRKSWPGGRRFMMFGQKFSMKLKCEPGIAVI